MFENYMRIYNAVKFIDFPSCQNFLIIGACRILTFEDFYRPPLP